MTFHTQVVGANGQRQAMCIERVEGFAEQILANFRLRPDRRDDRVQRGRHDGRADRDGDGLPRARGLKRDRRHVGRALARGRAAALLRHAAARPRGRRARPLHAARRRARRGRRRRTRSAPARRWPRSRSRTRSRCARRRAARRAGRAAAGAHERGSRGPRSVGAALRCGLRRACAPACDAHFAANSTISG